MLPTKCCHELQIYPLTAALSLVLGHHLLLVITSKVFCCRNSAKYPVGFPPPVVLGLGELRLPVMAVSIRPHGIIASCLQGSKNIRKHHVTALKIYEKNKKKKGKRRMKINTVFATTYLSFLMSLGQSLWDFPGNFCL